jgi:hypothetical protein
VHTSVPVPLWVAAALTLVLLVAADLVAVAQRDAPPSLRTCLWWVAANVSAAVLFGAALLATDGRAGTEFSRATSRSTASASTTSSSSWSS